MRKGITFDTGFRSAGTSTREPFDPEIVRHEMRVIRDDLHCDAVRVTGGYADRLKIAATHAAAAGLRRRSIGADNSEEKTVVAPTNDPYDLDRFVRAQVPDYERALSELRAGKKKSHWMWYIFPQIEGRGVSPMSVRYSIKSAPRLGYLASLRVRA